jgi:hypothetical protein
MAKMTIRSDGHSDQHTRAFESRIDDLLRRASRLRIRNEDILKRSKESLAAKFQSK